MMKCQSAGVKRYRQPVPKKRVIWMIVWFDDRLARVVPETIAPFDGDDPRFVQCGICGHTIKHFFRAADKPAKNSKFPELISWCFLSRSVLIGPEIIPQAAGDSMHNI